MVYEFKVTRAASIEETMLIDVEADDEEEAADIAYEMASVFPYTDLTVDRCLIRNRSYGAIGDIEVNPLNVEEPTIGAA